MGTHPIFEFDFDCLTDMSISSYTTINSETTVDSTKIEKTGSKLEASLRVQEFSLLKVPYEALNRKWRVGHKHLDMQVQLMAKSVSELSKSKSGDTTKANDAKKRLRQLREKILKINETQETECQLIKSRLDHLASFDTNRHSWQNDRFYRQLAEFLFQSGYHKTGLKLSDALPIREFVNSGLFLKIAELEEDLGCQKTQKCLAWCNQNTSRLRKIKSRFEWEIRLQDFIELIRANKRSEAVAYSRKYFPNLAPSHAELGAAMTLLVFQPMTHVGKYKSFFSFDRWTHLQVMCRSDILRLHQLGDVSTFESTLEAGLSALKTHQCFHENCRSEACPVCSTQLNSIAKRLPFAACTQSRLVCSASGDEMNENNPPVMLPNGNVYGKRAIDLLTHNGYVTCPRTQDRFKKEKFKRVFVM